MWRIAILIGVLAAPVMAQDGPRLRPGDPGYDRSGAALVDLYCPSPQFIEDIRAGAFDGGIRNDVFLFCSETIIRMIVENEDTRPILMEIIDILGETGPVE